MQNTSLDFKDYQRSKMHDPTKQFRETEEYELLKKKKAQAVKVVKEDFGLREKPVERNSKPKHMILQNG